MMSAHIIADAHIDAYPDGASVLDLLPPVARGDLIIIAGDLCNNLRKKAHRFLPDLVSAAGAGRVVVIPGNHDYYGDCLDKEDLIREEVEANGARFGQMLSVEDGGTRYLCATLWTDLRLAGEDTRVTGEAVRRVMNDYRHIRMERGGYRKIGTLDTMREHERHKMWLADRLREPHDGRTVVVTHHAPLAEAAGGAPEPVRLGMTEPDVRSAYASDLSGFMLEHGPDEWVFGHTHKPFGATVGRTVVRNVSSGYPHEMGRFREPDEGAGPSGP